MAQTEAPVVGITLYAITRLGYVRHEAQAHVFTPEEVEANPVYKMAVEAGKGKAFTLGRNGTAMKLDGCFVWGKETICWTTDKNFVNRLTKSLRGGSFPK